MLIFNNRFEMLRTLIPSGSEIAELGVLTGGFSQKLLELNPSKLHLIDMWMDTMTIEKGGQIVIQEPKSSLLETFSRFEKEISSGKVEIHICNSISFIKKYKVDAYYIDDLHEYHHLFQELVLVSKHNSLIFAHDYCEVFPGVVRAIDDFCKYFDYEIYAKTNEPTDIVYPREEWMPERISYNSVALRKNNVISQLY